jgi:hypothetical protein
MDIGQVKAAKGVPGQEGEFAVARAALAAGKREMRALQRRKLDAARRGYPAW